MSTEPRQTDVRSLNDQAEFGTLDQDFLDAFQAQGENSSEIVAGLEVSFGVSGMLYNSNMLMFDTQTSTVWSQLLGTGNVGSLTDTPLLRLPAQIVSFSEFKQAFPEAVVLSRDTGFSRRYGQNPYVGYDRADDPPFLFSGITDGRLPPKARIVSVDLRGDVVAYPFEILQEAHVVNDKVAGEAITVFWAEGTASALDQASIAASSDIGAVGVFDRVVAGRELSFRFQDDSIIDNETLSTWNLLGQAISGELEGTQLMPIVHDNTLWFAWAAFQPETRIFTDE